MSPAASHSDRSSDVPARAARPPLPVSAAAFVSSLDRFAISPLLVLVALDLGATLAQSLTVASAYYLAYGLSQPVWGVLSDRFGRIRLMRATLLAAAIAGVVSALAPGLVALIIARAFAGAFFGAVVPASLTFVGDTVDDAHRQPALADLMAAVALGTALATALAGVLGDFAHWRVVFAIPAVLSVACAIGLGRVHEESREAQAGAFALILDAVWNRWVLAVIGLAFMEGAVVLGVLTLLAPALQSQGVGAGGAGLATAAYGIGVIGATRLVRVVSRSVPMPGLMAIGGCAAVSGYAVLAVHVSIVSVIAAALLLGITWSFLHSSLQTWVTGVLPRARGTVVALFAGCLFAGSAVGASAGGAAASQQQWGLLFGVTSAVALVVTGAAVVSRRAYESRSLG